MMVNIGMEMENSSHKKVKSLLKKQAKSLQPILCQLLDMKDQDIIVSALSGGVSKNPNGTIKRTKFTIEVEITEHEDKNN